MKVNAAQSGLVGTLGKKMTLFRSTFMFLVTELNSISLLVWVTTFLATCLYNLAISSPYILQSW
jgi:hypothetical protein